ncbi:uncharacterized protein LOC130912315 isoform X2 [Corythoichthys intestinalis]|uniref:uncharacterized protein LOC130912315 isoform X2 n=1 Tax=Corythoichthys intestinalis TaxID=161448 RepID=UPI0025A647B7|nr:uncharacterized protein LOC130912315 isoform X2 [Corythoichthys intestinalis]
MAMFSPPANFSFEKPTEWPDWKQRFERYRIATKLDKDEGPVQRVQRPGENAESFIRALHEISKHCDFGAARDEHIRDRIVVGIRDKELSRMLQLMSDLTLALTIQTVRLSEEVRPKNKSTSWRTHRKQDTSPMLAEKKSKPVDVGSDGAVQSLANYLCTLRDHSRALSMEESSHIVSLWSALSDFDKARTVYLPRHQDTLAKGCFRATKKLVPPGVKSIRRCFAGSNTPAQWPDCNRVVEAIFVKLCLTITCCKKTLEGTRSRWAQVIHSYSTIRECIVTNANVMAETTLQLPEVNVATLAQWYNKRKKNREVNQGIIHSDGLQAGPVHLSTPQNEVFSTSPAGNKHVFVLPQNTTRMAKEEKPLQFAATAVSTPILISPISTTPVPHHQHPVGQGTSVQHPPPTPVMGLIIPVSITSLSARPGATGATFLLPQSNPHGGEQQVTPRPILPATRAALPAPVSSRVSLSLNPSLPTATFYYRKRKREREIAGIFSRKYVRKSEVIHCKACKKDRKSDGHHHHYGNWYCQETASQTLDEWREAMAAKGYGRKGTGQN